MSWLASFLILSGPITYVIVWLVVLYLVIFCDLSDTSKAALIAYAILPIGPVIQSGCGWLLTMI